MTKPSLSRRKFLATSGLGAAGVGLLPTPAIASGARQWKMVTSWPKGAPGVGVTAQRLADRITTMSGGKLTVKLYAAGELVPALEVFGAVGGGTAELGHTASFFWQGKAKASVFFTTIPFGLTALEHMAWINQGGGQELWDRLYQPFDIKPFMAGNTGIQMGGWFKKEVRSLDDLRGIKIRSAGLGGDLFEELGATSVLLAPGDIFPGLQNGLIDAAEFLGPWSDRAFGFYKTAPYYYWPSFNKPNGTAECLVNRTAFEELSDDLKAVVANACQSENAIGLSESDWENARALEDLVSNKNVQVREFPKDMLHRAKALTPDLLDKFVAGDAMAEEILTSYRTALSLSESWSRVSRQAFLAARDQ
ncbi:TRAP transporter substrate-binding protein [Sneathiella litorea]|uniref:Twin-arginine translocation signal domain-containing protein n=1 Tax=Sneathiella litorea TaxID=2606216 RepID=A0A6L8W425_9PROT|nr:TRAP transporter substrate-binding protein [Sneathiella litorea]MZR29856.1 twin-arginine translocation signal domain-containing protein [Sneathiella litorea]